MQTQPDATDGLDGGLSRRLIDRRAMLIGGAVIGASVLATGTASAQDATPEGSPEDSGMPPLPEGAIVVAEGLWNPGDLAVGPDGTLYIAEQGVAGASDTGGASMATPMADGSLPAASAMLIPPQISMVGADGVQSVLTSAVGGVGIATDGTTVFVAAGGGSVGSGFEPLPIENVVSAVDVASGTVTTLAEIGPNEVANNPDGLDVNPNLYGMALDATGMIYQTDAGGNTVYKIDPATPGTFELFQVMPTLTDLTGATPTAEEEAMQPGPRQPVPTAVVIDGDGVVTVVLLAESWDGPTLITYAADGTYTAHGMGLSMNVAAAYGPDGMLYVSQLTADFSGEMPAPGAVYRIGADDSVEAVVEGLFMPHGIAFDSAGTLYVTTNSIISGPDAPLGMVVKFEGIAPAA